MLPLLLLCRKAVHTVRDSAFIWEHSPTLPGGLARYVTSHWFPLRFLRTPRQHEVQIQAESLASLSREQINLEQCGSHHHLKISRVYHPIPTVAV